MEVSALREFVRAEIQLEQALEAGTWPQIVQEHEAYLERWSSSMPRLQEGVC